MKLIALKTFTPDGSRKIKSGESFEISDKSAQYLISTGYARRDVVEPENESPKSKREYKRRDLTAEK